MAASATSSSPCSCCSSSMAGSMRICDRRRRWSRWMSWRRPATSTRTTPASWPTRTGSCGASSTGSSCAMAPPSTPCPSATPTDGGSPARSTSATLSRSAPSSSSKPRSAAIRERCERSMNGSTSVLCSRRSPPRTRNCCSRPGAIEARLQAFGFSDGIRTRAAVRELTRGLTRSSRLMQQILPLLLGWLSESPDPDLGLLNVRNLCSDPRRSAEHHPRLPGVAGSGAPAVHSGWHDPPGRRGAAAQPRSRRPAA